MAKFSLHATARAYPKLPYEAMKDDVLGASYELSLVFVGARLAVELNKTYRNKDYVPNVLSFPLESSCGEIFITPIVAAREARRAGVSLRDRIGFLYIHGLLHLKGLDHGAKMDGLEQKYMKKYGLRN